MPGVAACSTTRSSKSCYCRTTTIGFRGRILAPGQARKRAGPRRSKLPMAAWPNSPIARWRFSYTAKYATAIRSTKCDSRATSFITPACREWARVSSSPTKKATRRTSLGQRDALLHVGLRLGTIKRPRLLRLLPNVEHGAPCQDKTDGRPGAPIAKGEVASLPPRPRCRPPYRLRAIAWTLYPKLRLRCRARLCRRHSGGALLFVRCQAIDANFAELPVAPALYRHHLHAHRRAAAFKQGVGHGDGYFLIVANAVEQPAAIREALDLVGARRRLGAHAAHVVPFSRRNLMASTRIKLSLTSRSRTSKLNVPR